MELTISSPEGILHKGMIKKVAIPTEIGKIVVMPGHEPLLSLIKSGNVEIWPETDPQQSLMDEFKDHMIQIPLNEGFSLVNEKGVMIVGM